MKQRKDNKSGRAKIKNPPWMSYACCAIADKRYC